jgi:iron(III) transport system permease protein
MTRRLGGWLLFGLIFAFFAAFLVWPIWLTIRGAFWSSQGATLAFVAEIFRHPLYRQGLLNALKVALTTTGLVFLIGVPLAVLASRFDFPGKGLFSATVLVPMILPPFVGAIGMRLILGQWGALNALLRTVGLLGETQTMDWLGQGQFWGVVLMEALHLYPILYLNALAALANLDPTMDEAALNLGASPWRRFRRVTLPLITPGLVAGGTIVFIWSFTELGTPLMFDYSRHAAVQIFNGIKEIGGDNPFPYALTAVMLIASGGLYGLSRWLWGGAVYATAGRATVASSARQLRGPAALLAPLAFAVVTGLAILPHLGVIAMSVSSDWYGTILPTGATLDHFRTALGHRLTVPSITNSIRYAGGAMIVDLILGVGMAYIAIRSNWRSRTLIDTMAMLPLAVPGLVLAFGYMAMTRPGEWFSPLDPVQNALPLLVIAYAVRRLPYVVRSAAAGLQQVSQELEYAAQNLGASLARTLRRVTIPLISANLLAGGLLAFSFAMLEVSDSIMLAQRQPQYPITKAIYELYQLIGEGRYLACALGVWAMAFLAITIVSASVLLGRRLGAIFRV